MANTRTETLEAKAQNIRQRLEKQRKSLSHLQRMADKAKKTALLARWQALGEAAEDVFGILTPEALTAILRRFSEEEIKEVREAMCNSAYRPTEDANDRDGEKEEGA